MEGLTPSPGLQCLVQVEKADEPLLQPGLGRGPRPVEDLGNKLSWDPQKAADLGRRPGLDEKFLRPQEQTKLTCEHSENSKRVFSPFQQPPETRQGYFLIPSADRPSQFKNLPHPSFAHKGLNRLKIDLRLLTHKEAEFVHFLTQAQEIRTLEVQEQ